MTIKFYLDENKAIEILKERGYQGSTILMLVKKDLGLGMNPCKLSEFSGVSSLGGFLRYRVFWKTPEEKKKILGLISGILYYLKNFTENPSRPDYRFYRSPYFLRLKIDNDGELSFNYSRRPEDIRETLYDFTSKCILTKLIKQEIQC